MEDTLESGWVAVRPNVFDEKEKHKFVFIVAWNEVESKFAVTCHDRTVQRRAAEGLALCGGADAGHAAGSPASRNGENKSPARAESPGRQGAVGAVPAAASGGLESLEPTAGKEEEEEGGGGGVREHSSWAGLFSFQDMRAVHQQLCSVNSDLEPCLPAFPEEPSAVWTVLFGLPQVSHRDVDALCYQLQVYLGHALDTCGWRILSQKYRFGK
ncbi:hypothetical protein Z043_102579 [Scleropages formosus]|uniref:JMY/WHAMM N-terminal domain-containing protein n=1 Tax=Scleropages formosus TaxID=113540 RepID=A0A0P7V733_SCLFO|nr:hypothetical protein Z043_102579 [Scleropages formosus]